MTQSSAPTKPKTINKEDGGQLHFVYSNPNQGMPRRRLQPDFSQEDEGENGRRTIGGFASYQRF